MRVWKETNLESKDSMRSMYFDHITICFNHGEFHRTLCICLCSWIIECKIHKHISYLLHYFLSIEGNYDSNYFFISNSCKPLCGQFTVFQFSTSYIQLCVNCVRFSIESLLCISLSCVLEIVSPFQVKKIELQAAKQGRKTQTFKSVIGQWRRCSGGRARRRWPARWRRGKGTVEEP